MDGFPYSIAEPCFMNSNLVKKAEQYWTGTNVGVNDINDYVFGGIPGSRNHAMGTGLRETLDKGLVFWADELKWRWLDRYSQGHIATTNLVALFPLFDMNVNSTVYDVNWGNDESTTALSVLHTGTKYTNLYAYHHPPHITTATGHGLRSDAYLGTARSVTPTYEATQTFNWWHEDNVMRYTNVWMAPDRQPDPNSQYKPSGTDTLFPLTDHTPFYPVSPHLPEMVYYVRLQPISELHSTTNPHEIDWLARWEVCELEPNTSVVNYSYDNQLDIEVAYPHLDYTENLVCTGIFAYERVATGVLPRLPVKQIGSRVYSSPPMFTITGSVPIHDSYTNQSSAFYNLGFSVDNIWYNSANPNMQKTFLGSEGAGSGRIPIPFAHPLVIDGWFSKIIIPNHAYTVGTEQVTGVRTVMGSITQWRNFFNELGLLHTTNQDEAINGNIEDWVYIPQPPEGIPTVPPVVPVPPTDPDSGGDNAGSGGQPGGGIIIPVPGTPNNDDIDSGLESNRGNRCYFSYVVDGTHIARLNALFSNPTWGESVNSFFQNPQTAVINLLRFPFNFTEFANEHLEPLANIHIAGKERFDANNIGMSGRLMRGNIPTAFKHSTHVINPQFGSFLDFSPYTEVSLAIPFIGTVKLDTNMLYELNADNQLIGKPFELWYDFSYDTGSCLAWIQYPSATGKRTSNILGSWEGMIAQEIPLMSSNKAEKNINGMVSAIKGVADIAGSVSSGAKTVALSKGKQAPAVAGQIAGSVVGAVGGVISASAGLINSQSRMNTQHSLALPLDAYTIVERPRSNFLQAESRYKGHAVNVYERLDTLNGFTVCESVRLPQFPKATITERDEIKQYLESGVILGIQTPT